MHGNCVSTCTLFVLSSCTSQPSHSTYVECNLDSVRLHSMQVWISDRTSVVQEQDVSALENSQMDMTYIYIYIHHARSTDRNDLRGRNNFSAAYTFLCSGVTEKYPGALL
ncbi:unnamed protein product [Choristocarpus tenellus]